MKALWSVATVLLLASCVDDYERPPEGADEKTVAARCEAEGGQFARTGLNAQIAYCQMPKRPARDAGKSCTSGEQCEAGACVAATHSCAPVVNAMYCEPQMEHGSVVEVQCAE